MALLIGLLILLKYLFGDRITLLAIGWMAGRPPRNRPV